MKLKKMKLLNIVSIITSIIGSIFYPDESYAHRKIDYINLNRGTEILGASVNPNLKYDFDNRYIPSNRCIKGEYVNQKNLRIEMGINKKENNIFELQNSIKGADASLDLIIISGSSKTSNSRYFTQSKTKLSFNFYIKISGFNTFLYEPYKLEKRVRNCSSEYISGIYRGIYHKVAIEMEFFELKDIEKFLKMYTTGFFFWKKSWKNKQFSEKFDNKVVVIIKHNYIGQYDQSLSEIHNGSLKKENLMRCSGSYYKYCLDKASELSSYILSKDYLESVVKKDLFVIQGLKINTISSIERARSEIKKATLLDQIYSIERDHSKLKMKNEKLESIKFLKKTINYSQPKP